MPTSVTNRPAPDGSLPAPIPAQPFSLYYAALHADNAWHHELARMFGNRAGDARYDKRGVSTPTLASLHKDFREKLDAWLQEMSSSREANL